MNEKSDHPLKQWRGDRPQRWAAEQLEVDAMTYSRWERGLFLPRRKARAIIEGKTGIPAAKLVTSLKDNQ